MPTIKRDLEDWAKQAASWWENQGAASSAALQMARLYAYSWAAGTGPNVSSVFRNPSKQKAMLDAWNRGERAGLRAQPADPKTSAHCYTGYFGKPAARAVDMPSRNDKRTAEIARWLGLTAGENFRTRDPGHYKVP